MTRSVARKNRSREKSLPIPTQEDWGDYESDLDQKHAHSVFGGRTSQEVQSIFRRNPVEATDELRWMPEIPFRYYMLAFRDFIMAGQFDFLSASDAASCFIGLVLEKLETQSRHIAPIMPELLPAVEYVSRNQSQFEADVSIYGNFLDKPGRIHTLNPPDNGSQRS
jgi:hypothetical protein